LEQYLARPAHAVLLAGPAGSGKRAIAEAIVADVLGLERPRLGSYPYFMLIGTDGNSISIEAIRGLQKFLQLKTTGDRQLRRAVIIEYAHSLTTEAQNAFLKLLEEPPADTLIVLTASSPRSLRPTILSRMQTITVHVPSEEQLEPMLTGSGHDAITQKQAFFLSGGMPGLLHALLHDEAGHPLLTAVNLAKEILQKTPFERLALVDGLSKQKEAAGGLIDALERIAAAGLKGAGKREDTAHIRQWHQIRKSAVQAQAALRANANPKLTLANLFINLK
jgi:replication-associated recombination protein RarA